MFIFKSTLKKANIHSPYTAPDGTRYTTIPRDLVEEIPDPQPPTPPEGFTLDEAFFRTEQDDAPYIVWTPRSPEALAEIQQAKLNSQSEAYLRETDWMVIRAIEEPSKQVPQEVKDARAAARGAIVRKPKNG